MGRAGLEPAAPGLKGRTPDPVLSPTLATLARSCHPPAPRIAPSSAPHSPDPVARALLLAVRSWIDGCTIFSLRRNLLEILLSLEADTSAGTISAPPGDERT